MSILQLKQFIAREHGAAPVNFDTASFMMLAIIMAFALTTITGTSSANKGEDEKLELRNGSSFTTVGNTRNTGFNGRSQADLYKARAAMNWEITKEKFKANFDNDT